MFPRQVGVGHTRSPLDHLPPPSDVTSTPTQCVNGWRVVPKPPLPVAGASEMPTIVEHGDYKNCPSMHVNSLGKGHCY